MMTTYTDPLIAQSSTETDKYADREGRLIPERLTCPYRSALRLPRNDSGQCRDSSRLAETTAGSSPGLDFAPVPDERGPQCGDWFWEVVVALSPDVDDLGAADVKAFRDLVCSD